MNVHNLINHLRWLSALAVCLAHTRITFFPEADDAGELGVFGFTFYGITMFGPEAVVIFFAISGYLVGGRVWDDMTNGRFDLGNYAVARASRILIVFLPVLAITVLLGQTRCSDDLMTIVGNGLLLQNITVAPICNNEPLWSLSSEVAYYIAAPFVIAAIMRKEWALVVLSFGAAILLGGDGMRNLGFGAMAWSAGVIAANSSRTRSLVPVATFIAALLLSRAAVLPHQTVGLALVAIATAWLLRCDRAMFSALPRLGRYASEASFSLYLIHMPVTLAFAGIVGPLSHNSAADVGTYIAINAACLLAAAILYWMAERHTGSARRMLNRHFRLRQTPSRSSR